MDLTRYIVLACLPEPDQRRIREALGARGHRFLTAADRREALAYVRQYEPSLVFIPVTMIDGACYDFCQQVKEADGLGHVGMLVVGQVGDRYDLTAGLVVGVDEFIAAHVSDETLSETALNLAEAMERKTPLKRRAPFRESAEAAAPPAAQKPATPDSADGGMPPAAAGDPLRYFFDERTAPPASEATSASERRLEQISEAASDEIAQFIARWMRFHAGRRVDETMMQNVARAIKPTARAIVQSSLRKLAEKE